MSLRVPRSKSSLRFVGGCSIRKEREGTVTVSWPGIGVKKKEVGYWSREVLVREGGESCVFPLFGMHIVV